MSLVYELQVLRRVLRYFDFHRCAWLLPATAAPDGPRRYKVNKRWPKWCNLQDAFGCRGHHLLLTGILGEGRGPLPFDVVRDSLDKTCWYCQGLNGVLGH